MGLSRARERRAVTGGWRVEVARDLLRDREQRWGWRTSYYWSEGLTDDSERFEGQVTVTVG